MFSMKRSSIHSLFFRRAVALLVPLFLMGILLGSCEKDKKDYSADIVRYAALCPGGTQECYTDCGTRYDDDGDGAVEASNLEKFNSCTASCDVNCDLTFLYYFLLFK